MTSDSHNPLSLPEAPPGSSTPRRPRKWSGLALFLGIVYLLTGTCAQFQDAVGRSLSNLIQLIGLAIVIWASISLARARPIRPWVLPIAAMPLILLVTLTFAFSYGSAGAHVRLGNAYAKQGKFEKAIDEYAEAITLDPELAAAYYNRGNAYLHRNDLGQAIRDYSQAIDIKTRDPQYYNNRGAAHLMAEDYRAAVTDFTEAIRLDGRLAQAYFGRSLALAELGETEGSQADLAKARELDPKMGRE